MSLGKPFNDVEHEGGAVACGAELNVEIREIEEELATTTAGRLGSVFAERKSPVVADKLLVPNGPREYGVCEVIGKLRDPVGCRSSIDSQIQAVLEISRGSAKEILDAIVGDIVGKCEDCSVEERVFWNIKVEELKSLINGDFSKSCQIVIEALDDQRFKRGEDPYSHNERVILIGEMLKTAYLFREVRRKTGESYFDTHLVESTLNLVLNNSVTELSRVLTVLNHDTIEDIADELRDLYVGSPEDFKKELRFLLKAFTGDDGELAESFLDGLAQLDLLIVLAEQCEAHGVEKLDKSTWKILRRDPELNGLVLDLRIVLEDVLQSILLNSFLYKKCFAESSSLDESVVVEDLAANVFKGIHALSKPADRISKTDRKSGAYEIFLKESIDDAMVLLIKVAENLHNLSTLEGHPDLEKRKKEAQYAEQYFLPLLRGRASREMVDSVVDACCVVLNLDFYRKFYAEAEKRIRMVLSAQVGATGNILYDRLRGLGTNLGSKISSVQIIPKRLGSYFSGEADLEDARFEDLNIFLRDPMFEVAFLVKSEDSINDALAHLFSAFTDGDSTGTSFQRKNPKPDEKWRGVEAYVSNKKWGGDFRIRVMTDTDFYKMKRGFLNNGNQFPVDVRETIKAALDREVTKARGTQGLAEAVKDELLKPRLQVFSEEGEEWYFAQGSTMRDFVAVTMKAAYIFMNFNVAEKWDEESRSWRKISNYDLLEYGARYRARPANIGEKSFKAINITPDELYFCGSYARKKLVRPHLSRGVDGAKIDRANSYLSFLSSTFAFPGGRFALLSELHNREDYVPGDWKSAAEKRAAEAGYTETLIGIAEGDINCLEWLAGKLQGTDEWTIKVGFPEDGPRVLMNFLADFGRMGASVYLVGGTRQEGDLTVQRLKVKYDNSKKDVMDFLLSLIKLNKDGYQVKLSQRSYQSNSNKKQ